MERTIDNFLRHIAAQGRTPNTISAYRTDLHGFCAFVQGIEPPVVDWRDITALQATQFMAQLTRQGLSPSTITRKAVVLKRFFAYLGKQFPIPEKPAKFAQPAGKMSHPPDTLRPSTIEALLSHVAQSPKPTAARDHALLTLLCKTGARASELANANVGDLNLARREIVLGGPRQREIALDQSSVESLAQHLSGSGPSAQAPLFRNQRGQRLTRQGIWLIVRTHAAALGLENVVSPRSLRQAAKAHLTHSQSAQAGKPTLLLDGVRALA